MCFLGADLVALECAARWCGCGGWWGSDRAPGLGSRVLAVVAQRTHTRVARASPERRSAGVLIPRPPACFLQTAGLISGTHCSIQQPRHLASACVCCGRPLRKPLLRRCGTSTRLGTPPAAAPGCCNPLCGTASGTQPTAADSNPSKHHITACCWSHPRRCQPAVGVRRRRLPAFWCCAAQESSCSWSINARSA